MKKSDYQERYDRWWLGKMCKPRGYKMHFKRVVQVQLIGPPSFVYGHVKLHFSDGDVVTVHQGEAYRPRKRDVEVLND